LGGEKRPMTDKILSPEEIKAMLGKRITQREEPRNYAGIQRTEVVRHTETVGQQPSIFIGKDVEPKQPYFDHLPNLQSIDHQYNRISSFSPEFNQYQNANISNNFPLTSKNSDP
jgi:hypothetical protein